MNRPPRPSAPALTYVSGDPSLDLVNTVDWTSRGLVNERLTDYDRLTHWAEGAGVILRSAGERLRRTAARRPREARAALERARSVRGTLQRLFVSVPANRRMTAALGELNALLAEIHTHSRLKPAAANTGGAAAEWGWHDSQSLEFPLWPVIRNAADLLASGEAANIRVCGGVDCGWMYVDRSRNGLRRWCQMETCGTREKSRRRAMRGG